MRKCITIKEPFASAIVAGVKTSEVRSWPTSYRGRLWIHASAKRPGCARCQWSLLQGADICDCEMGAWLESEVQRCAGSMEETIAMLIAGLRPSEVIGAVTVIDCVPSESFPEHFEWLLVSPTRYEDGQKLKGRLSFWDLDERGKEK